jgi:hypothetical protein
MSNTTMLKEQRPLRYFMPGQPLDEQIDILDSLISTAP